MIKVWDGLMKSLAQASPQDLISWFFPNALYEGELNTEMPKEPIRADLMYIMRWKGKQVGFHVEFQKESDKKKVTRRWGNACGITMF